MIWVFLSILLLLLIFSVIVNIRFGKVVREQDNLIDDLRENAVCDRKSELKKDYVDETMEDIKNEIDKADSVSLSDSYADKLRDMPGRKTFRKNGSDP